MRRPAEIAAALLAGFLFVIACMAVADITSPEGDEPARDRAQATSVVRPLRGETTTTSTTTTSTTTTVPPTTTTTATPTTTSPPAPAQAPAVAPEAPPAPVTPSEGLWGVYGRCSRSLASNLVVVPGDTSWATTDGTIKVGQWHVDQGGSILCWTFAHEDGHLWAFRYGTQAYLGAPPAGFASGDVETWADCYAFVLTGYDRGGCGVDLAASARAVM